MFATLLAGIDGVDVRQCALNGSHVLAAKDKSAARHELVLAGFSAPYIDSIEEVDFGDFDLGDISTGTSGSEYEAGSEADRSVEPAEVVGANVADTAIGSDARTNPASPTNRSQHPGGSNARGPVSENGDSDDGAKSASQITRKSQTARTEWMRSYVSPLTGEKSSQTSTAGEVERNSAIDQGAMEAAIDYETSRGWIVERMPHFNPGYDIVSRSQDKRRVIEVKGLQSEWTGRGVKLSKTQIVNAQERGDEYWLYVVENALDVQSRKVHAIRNPFLKAHEFWFDDAWKGVADEKVGGAIVRYSPGRRVKVKDWGLGTILDFNQLLVRRRRIGIGE